MPVSPLSAQTQFADLGKAHFPDVTMRGTPHLVDVDSDGDLDVVFAGEKTDRLFLNDGESVFSEAPTTWLPPRAFKGKSTCAISGDVDGDGDADLFIASTGLHSGSAQNRLYLNNGKGSFTDVTRKQLPLFLDPSIAARFVDIDGDKDLDLVVANIGYPVTSMGNYVPVQNRVYRNDGQGVFADITTTHAPALKDLTGGLAIGDFDGNGTPDIVFCESQGTVKRHLWLNDGKGKFKDVTTSHFPSNTDSHTSVAAADIDGDGDLDLLFAGWDKGKGLLYLNNGKGIYTDVSSRLGTTPERIRSIHFVDIDEDGDLDLRFVTQWFPVASRFWINDGKGIFKEVSKPRIGPPVDWVDSPVTFIDIDGDGDKDCVSAERLLLNRHRQIHAPWVARTGRSWALDFYSEFGAPTGASLALPYFGLKKARLPIPGLGVFGIDPTNILVGLPLTIPATTGMTRSVLRIPKGPSLLGKTLYIQALIVSRLKTPPGIWKLSNVLIEPIYK